MKRWLRALVTCGAALFAALPLCARAAPPPAHRIVSLAPHATELLYAAGAGEFIVGAIEYSNYPPEAKRIPRVGDNRALDLERIAALKPDLVIAWPYGYGSGQVDALRKLDLRVELSDPHDFEDVAREIEHYGELADTRATAHAAAAAYRLRVQRLRERYAHRAPVSVFYEIWNQPLFTLNGRHIVSRAIELCGGRNVFAELPVLAPSVSTEAVVAADPEAIVTATEGAGMPQWLTEWKRWPGLRAVRRSAFIVLDGEQMNRATPRMLDAVADLCAGLDAVRAAAGRDSTGKK